MKKSKRKSKQSVTVSPRSPDISAQESEAERTARYCRAMEEHWRALEKMYWILRPSRSDPVEKLHFSFRSAFCEGAKELSSILDELYGVRVVDHFNKTVERTRAVNIDRDGGFHLTFYLILGHLLYEAHVLLMRRVLSGHEGTNRYRLPGHHHFGKPCPTGTKQSILYRSLRLAFCQLRSAPNRFASILKGDLSEDSVLAVLAGWGLSKSPFSNRKRLQAAVNKDERELRFMAALAYSIAERKKGQRFFVKDENKRSKEKSVFHHCIKLLEAEAPDAIRGRRVVSQDEAGDLPAGELHLARVAAAEDLADLCRMAGLDLHPMLELLQAGYNGPEIAEELGMTPGAVRAAKLRLIKRLRAAAKKSPDSA